MIDALKNFFEGTLQRAKDESLLEHPENLPGDQTDTILFGLLLAEVAKADGDYSEAEEQRILDILLERGELGPEQAKLALAAAHEARAKRYDLQGFTRELKELAYPGRLHLLELLFEVAFVDGKLEDGELHTIRKISGLLWINAADFAETRVKIRKKLQV